MRGMIGLVVGAALALGLGPVLAAESRYFSIATAGEAGTYFPVGDTVIKGTLYSIVKNYI